MFFRFFQNRVADLSYAQEWYTKLSQNYEGITSEQFAVFPEPAAQTNLKTSFVSLILQVLSFKVAFANANPDSLQYLEKVFSFLFLPFIFSFLCLL